MMALQLTPNISYFDKSFKESQTKKYTISIQLWLKGLVLTIYDPELKKFIGVESYNFPDIDNVEQIPSFLSKIINKIPWFAFPFGSVYLLYQNTYSTLIPQPLFSNDNSSLYLEFNQPMQENSRVVNDTLKNNQAVNVYYMSNPVIEKIKYIWPNANILHYSTALIEGLSVNFKNKVNAKTLFVNLRDNSFDLIYFKENKLHFYNSFNFLSKEDFIYFLLISIDQLFLNPEDVELIISGNINKTDNKYNMIHQYIKNYTFISRNDNYSYSYVLDEIADHKYYVLFNALQCE